MHAMLDIHQRTLFFFWALAAFIVAQRVLELRLARRNTRIAVSRGAVEYGREHYFLFFVLHTGWMAGWIFESLAGSLRLNAAWSVFLGLFVAAEVLRYWAIFTLGIQWNTRIFILPGEKPVTSGPYRFIRHPNYVAVALELFAVPMIFDSWITAAVCTLANAALLIGIRIPEENRARTEQ